MLSENTSKKWNGNTAISPVQNGKFLPRNTSNYQTRLTKTLDVQFADRYRNEQKIDILYKKSSNLQNEKACLETELFFVKKRELKQWDQ